MNKVTFEIDNCCDCPYSYTERICTLDTFEHEDGIYCSNVEDKQSYNKKNKLILADELNIREWGQIPDWCPLLKSKTINGN